MESTPSSGEHAYIISLTDDNKIGEGTYSEVYKIYSKKDQKVYAAKLFKQPYKMMDDETKLGFEREKQILK